MYVLHRIHFQVVASGVSLWSLLQIWDAGQLSKGLLLSSPWVGVEDVVGNTSNMISFCRFGTWGLPKTLRTSREHNSMPCATLLCISCILRVLLCGHTPSSYWELCALRGWQDRRHVHLWMLFYHYIVSPPSPSVFSFVDDILAIIHKVMCKRTRLST